MHNNFRLLGPAVRLMLERYGLDASKLVGSGPKGIVIKQDVVNFVEKNKLSAVPPKEGKNKVVLQ